MNKKKVIMVAMGGFLLTSLLAQSHTPTVAPATSSPAMTDEEKDKLAIRISVLLSKVTFDYSRMMGQYKLLEDMGAEGYLLFPLINPYTGQPMKNTCDRESLGDYCMRLLDPYSRIFYTYNKVYLEHRARTGEPPFVQRIPEWQRDKPVKDSIFEAAQVLGYSETEKKLMFLGLTIANALQSAYDDKDWGNQPISYLSVSPVKQVIDPRTGALVDFNGSGYGDLVQLSEEKNHRVRVRVYDGGKLIFSCIVGAHKEFGSRHWGVWRVYQVPIMPSDTPREEPLPLDEM